MSTNNLHSILFLLRSCRLFFILSFFSFTLFSCYHYRVRFPASFFCRRLLSWYLALLFIFLFFFSQGLFLAEIMNIPLVCRACPRAQCILRLLTQKSCGLWMTVRVGCVEIFLSFYFYFYSCYTNWQIIYINMDRYYEHM